MRMTLSMQDIQAILDHYMNELGLDTLNEWEFSNNTKAINDLAAKVDVERTDKDNE